MVVKQRIISQRLIPTALETRGVVADWRSGERSLTLYTSTQIPHLARTLLSQMLAMPENRLRVVAPEVGGGFGSKLNVYAEEALMGFVATRIGKPVKWIESRRENFQSTIHGRGHVDYYEIAATQRRLHSGPQAEADSGPGRLPPVADARHPHALRADDAGHLQVPECARGHRRRVHQRVPTDAYRGAGRPEATHGIERMVDMLAAELKMDPAEIRFQNFPGPDEFPYATATGLTYDSGNYAAPLRKALAKWRTTPSFAMSRRRRARRRPPDGHRHLHLRRNLRHRTVARNSRRRMGKRHRADRPDRQGHRHDRRIPARPGRGDYLRPDRRRRARRDHGRCPGAAWRHRHRPVRHRHLRQPRHRDRRDRHVLRAARSQAEGEAVRRHAARFERHHVRPGRSARTTAPAKASRSPRSPPHRTAP